MDVMQSITYHRTGALFGDIYIHPHHIMRLNSNALCNVQIGLSRLILIMAQLCYVAR